MTIIILQQKQHSNNNNNCHNKLVGWHGKGVSQNNRTKTNTQHAHTTATLTTARATAAASAAQRQRQQVSDVGDVPRSASSKHGRRRPQRPRLGALTASTSFVTARPRRSSLGVALPYVHAASSSFPSWPVSLATTCRFSSTSSTGQQHTAHVLEALHRRPSRAQLLNISTVRRQL